MRSFLRAPANWPWIVAIFYSVGLISHAVPLLLGYMLALTPWFLLISGLVMTSGQLQTLPRRPYLIWFVGASAATFVAEVVGVATGAIFGPYHYTDVLGFSVAGVPLIIGLNWVLAVWGIHSAIRAVFPRWPRLVLALLTGVGCVLFDLILEPVAIGLGYWVWHDGTIPLQNYVAWGVIGTVVSAFLPLRRAEEVPPSLILSWYVLIQTVFFAGINLWILLGWIP